DETIDITINEKAKQMLDDKKEPSEGSENAGLTEDDSSLWMTAHFNNLEDVIQLSHYINSSYESELITVYTIMMANIICILNCLLNCLSTKRIYSVKYLNTARNQTSLIIFYMSMVTLFSKKTFSVKLENISAQWYEIKGICIGCPFLYCLFNKLML